MAQGVMGDKPFLQVQQQPVTPPTQPAALSEETPPAPSHNQKLSGATPEAGLSQGAPSTPSALISSLQQLQLAGSTPESLLLCQELLADGSSGQASMLKVLTLFPHVCASE